MSRALTSIEGFEADRDTSGDIFDHLSTFAIEHKPSPENVDAIISEIETDNPRFASMLRALSRMTLTPTMVRGGVKSNSVPESIRLTCDVRTLPHQDDDYVRSTAGRSAGRRTRHFLRNRLHGPAQLLALRVAPVPAASSGSRPRHCSGTTSSGCRPSATAFTDSRFTRPLGTVTYGFSGSHPDDDPMLNYTHGTNESVGIKSLVSGAKIMLGLACDMLAVK